MINDLRSRIDGAKNRCMAMPETHCRTVIKHHTRYIVTIFQKKPVVDIMLIDPRLKQWSSCHTVPARNNAYDGVQEFWITIRESGEKTEEHMKKSTGKNQRPPACDCLEALRPIIRYLSAPR